MVFLKLMLCCNILFLNQAFVNFLSTTESHAVFSETHVRGFNKPPNPNQERIRKMKTPPFLLKNLLLALSASALLTACGGGGGDDSDQATRIDTAGRLALSEYDKPALRIHDLDGGQPENVFALSGAAAAVYASPSGRYAVTVQRAQDTVQFIDGGIWQEDHVDHLHDYKQASKLVPWILKGPQPTHFDVQNGVQAAIFMDGNATTTPSQNAAVRLITDASIAKSTTEAAIDLSAPIHGLAEPVGNTLLVAHRQTDASDALPTHLHAYTRRGAGYEFQRQLNTRCDGMHGSFTAAPFTAAGCTDGVLLVEHTAAGTIDSRVNTPIRIGTIAGHHQQAGRFIGIGNDGVTPNQTTRFFSIDAAAKAAVEIVPEGWELGTIRRAHGFDRKGLNFYILDNQGNLYVMQRSGNAWKTAARLPKVISTMPTVAPFPVMATNGSRDEVYLTDPVSQQLVVVSSADHTIKNAVSLGFKPASMAWLGISR